MKKNHLSKSNKISACLVLYHEQEVIARCLDSIKDYVDEIIIVHDGKCLDNTLKIAKKYNARIFIRKHIGAPETHRVFSFNKVKGDWILQIDADEYFSKDVAKQLKKLVSDDSVDAYRFKWNFYNYKETVLYEPKLCLYRKAKTRPCKGIPHEPFVVKGKIVDLDLELIHKPKNSPYSLNQFKKKGIDLARVQADCLIKVYGKKPFVYFFKMLFLPFVYFVLAIFRYWRFRVGFFHFIYNFYVYWRAFKKSL